VVVVLCVGGVDMCVCGGRGGGGYLHCVSSNLGPVRHVQENYHLQFIYLYVTQPKPVSLSNKVILSVH
jgi:hypothetical protein